MSSPPLCTSASARAAKRISRTACSRPCGTSLVDTSKNLLGNPPQSEFLLDRRPASKPVRPVPEQPFILAGAAERRQHLSARCACRGLGRAIADGDDLLHGFAKALVGIGVD